MCDKGHKYAKFNESYLFCQKCGTFLAGPVYRSTWTYPYRPYVPYWTTPWYGGNSTIFTNADSFSWTTLLDDNTTFTMSDGVNKDDQPDIQGSDPKKKTIKGTIDPQKKK